MTQTEAVLRLLRLRGSAGLTPLEAFDAVGTMRLAARVSDAKLMLSDDEEIVTERQTTPTGKSVARYVLRRRQTPGLRQETLPW